MSRTSGATSSRAVGLAMPWPAISRPEPCAPSKIAACSRLESPQATHDSGDLVRQECRRTKSVVTITSNCHGVEDQLHGAVVDGLLVNLRPPGERWPSPARSRGTGLSTPSACSLV